MQRSKVFKPSFLGAKPSSRSFNGRQAIDDMYDENWEKYRLEFLSHNPRCYSCGLEAEAVDHIIPHKGDKKLFWKEDNYIPLCHKCHNTITSLFDRHHRPGDKDISKKLRWIAANRVRFMVAFKVKVLPFTNDLLRKIGRLP